MSGITEKAVSEGITGLTQGKMYYYKLVAKNSAGTKEGSKMTVKTLDTTIPVGSVVIKGGDEYTNATGVTLGLTATDNVGVTGYYISMSDVKPAATAEGWTTVTATSGYNESVVFTLSSGDEKKTVNVWYKDESGNISDTASDSIVLDTKAPVVTIVNPTSEATYITTAGTINLGGNATDSGSGISSVVWSSDKGASGIAGGTTSWTISGISLTLGDTVVTATAKDAAGNTGSSMIIVKYGTAPVVATASATNVTSNSATLNGVANAGGLSTTTWFEYGTATGTYNTTTPTQVISGLNDVAVNADITGLLQSKGYYYRIVAQNIAGTVYGSEMTLKTLDITPPQGSIVINGGDAYTNSTAVKVSLLAIDNEGITGYYFSVNNVTPSATAEGWTNVTPSPSYSASALYTLGSGDGIKTLYVWYKDAAGNISGAVSDSINLDTTAPVVAIASPVSGDTYSTTSVLINLGGSASDGRSGISRVIWSTDKGSSGLASGTTNWTVAGVSLGSGNTVITVTATDGAGNTGTDTLTVSVSVAGLTNGLKAFYNFDEGSGKTAFDTSGYANNGIISGATWTTGKIKGGLKFNGTSSYVSIPPVNSDEVSFSAWFYKNAKDAINSDAMIGGWFWSSNVQSQEGFDVRFSPAAPDTLEFALITKSAAGTRAMKTARYKFVNSVGSWFHAAGIYNKSTGEQKLYINGQLANTQLHPAGNTIVPLKSYPDMRIGHSRVNNGYFNGTIDEVRFYNRALTNQEVVDLYNAR